MLGKSSALSAFLVLLFASVVASTGVAAPPPGAGVATAGPSLEIPTLPEPGTLVVVGSGIVGLALVSRWRRRRRP